MKPKLLILEPGKGKTSALAKWVKVKNGLMICFSEKEAERIRRDFAIKAIVFGPGKLEGFHFAIAIDNLWMFENPKEVLYEAMIHAGDTVLCSMDNIFDLITTEEIFFERMKEKNRDNKR